MTLHPLELALRERRHLGVADWLYPTFEKLTPEAGRILVERCIELLDVLDSLVPPDDPCASDWRNDNARDMAATLRLIGTYRPELALGAIEAMRRIEILPLTAETRESIADKIEYLLENHVGKPDASDRAADP